MKILLGITGSVAATLTPKIIASLKAAGYELKVVSTERGLYFFDPAKAGEPIMRDKDEWTENRYQRDQGVPHIDLNKWADLFLIAPLTADTLADIANGKADKFLTSIARAWPREKPLVVAPAMNTNMWTHPITGEQLQKIASWFPNFRVVPPTERRLACGDVGVGALAEIKSIIDFVSKFEK
jgi:phosphopantothenoylcysteine decarboxylase